MFDNLFQSVKQVFQLKELTDKALNRLGISTILDLIFFSPRNVVRKEYVADLNKVEVGSNVIIQLTYLGVEKKDSIGKKLTKLICEHATGQVDLVYYNYYPQHIIKSLHNGKSILVSGKLDFYGNFQIKHPEKIVFGQDFSKINHLDVIYPLSYGITNEQVGNYVGRALNLVPFIAEWLPKALVQKHDWPSFNGAIQSLHNPHNLEDLSLLAKHRVRLAFDELLANQIGLKLLRNRQLSNSKDPIIGDGTLTEKLLATLPFKLTESQIDALSEIFKDQSSNQRMLRLLQGDVGSGKTVVALLAALNNIESGHQSAIMAPTELLATQHYRWISEVTKDLGITVKLLTSKSREKKDIQQALENGDINLIIGTHALFQEGVNFESLTLVIIDEQHRFGVKQRLELTNKGKNPDILLMTATPIPRSLCLTNFGDMDVTRMFQKPMGRKHIITSALNISRFDEIKGKLISAINSGKKIYWVCPLIEQQDSKDNEEYEQRLAASIKRYDEFNEIFPGQVGLVHGRLKPDVRQEEMEKFANSTYRILVATTVIEVGIDVKDASIMFIENAERFGLSQLHQLRGRVGRGDEQSYCLLLYKLPFGKNSKERLEIMRATNDGFEIAEQDLVLRGGGDILGTKQSGLPEFKFADLALHSSLLQEANAVASEMFAKDLLGTENVQNLLRLLGNRELEQGDEENVLEKVVVG